MKIKFSKILIIPTIIVIPILIFSNLNSVPMNNYYDSAAFYDFKGTDKYYSNKKQPWFSFSLSPYYQNSSGCRGLDGDRMDSFVDQNRIKLGEGDRLGVWNMLGLFYGTEASPTGDESYVLKYDESAPPAKVLKADVGAGKYYQTLALSNVVLDANENTKVATSFTSQEINDSQANLTGANSHPKLIEDFTDVENFDPTLYYGRVSVPIDFERFGVRGKFNFDLCKWWGLNVKTGVCYYHQDPTFDDQLNRIPEDQGYENKTLIQRYLTNDEKFKKIVQNELGINIADYSKTAMEDTHIETYFNWPIKLKDEDGDHVMSFIPIFSIGVWAPTGDKKKEDYWFSLATGNDGYTGLTLQGSLNMDFPGTVQLAFGLGGAFFNRRELKNVHFPSNNYQYGIYPWTIDIKKRPGVTWYANASFKAGEFLNSLSFYFDFIHTQHEKDSVTFQEERKDEYGDDLFNMEKYRNESSWRNLNLFCGLDYKIVPGLEIGASFQTVLSGLRVYRTTTLLGTVKLNF